MQCVSNRRFAPLALAITAIALGACASKASPEPKTTATTPAAPPLTEAQAASRFAVGPQCRADQRSLAAAPASGMYHSAMPSLLHNDADSEGKAAADVHGFQRLAKRRLAWVYFSDNWFEGISFPSAAVEAIRKQGAMPFIRLMPRSSWEDRAADARYPLDRIARGDFDADLRRWAHAARETRLPMLLDFAPEMNGNWFPWSGMYNGGERSGPQTYRAAYRHVINLFRSQGADNVGFAFHANWRSDPRADWNDIAAYYPGDDYIDWLGVSAYGSVEPGPWEPLDRALDEVYPQLAALSPSKPIALLETGVVEEPGKSKASWIRSGYTALRAGRYPRVKAVSWWQERWRDQNGGPDRDTRVNSSSSSAAAYRRAVASRRFISRPSYTCVPKG
jgi:hypothetical protein